VRAPPPLAQNLLLSAASLVLAVGGSEALCRLLERPPAEAVAAEEVADWTGWDGEFFTARGWSPARDFNRDGLRDRERAVAKLPGTRRLMCLGDSTTYGFHLKPEQAYPQVLQALLDERGGGVEVFNVALPGWSARQQLIAYRRICRKYRPDQLLLGICLNDVADMQNNLSRPHAALSWLHRRSALVRRVVDAEGRQIRSLEELFEPEPNPRVAGGYARLFADLTTLRQEAAADGVGFAILVFPVRSQLAPGAPPPRPQQAIAEFCRSQGIPLLDTLPALRRAAQPAFIDVDHLTAAGLRVVAEEVAASGILAVPDGAGPPTGLAATSVATLIRELDDDAPAVRAAAAASLEKAGPSAQPAAPALLARLRDPDDNVRLRAADALVALRPDVGWLPQLRPVLEEGAPSERAAAARVVAALGPEAREAVASLAAALEQPGREVQEAAAYALGQIGPDARAGVPALVGVMTGAGEARFRAAEALGLIRDASAAPALCGALEDAQGDMRWQAARALGRIGAGALACAPALLEALGDPNADVRMAAARALPRLGVERERLEPALEKLRSDPDGDVRAEAARALRSLRRESEVGGRPGAR
jgi:HEAT repeat protein/lysophospholipase L1-like esterase